jgi:cytochrome c oxidase subunit 2
MRDIARTFRKDVMKLSRTVLTALFVCTFVVAGHAAALAGSQDTVASSAPQTIAITASNWKFAPSEITVHANQPVKLELSSSEGVHGFSSSDLGIANTLLTPGSTKTIEFTPSKPGTYTVHCSVFCGQGHGDMTLIVKVVA